MAIDFDPLSDDEPRQLATTSRESIKSFWLGISGVAVLVHVAIYLTLTATNRINWWLADHVFQFLTGPSRWQSQYILWVVSGESLIPCLVMSAVVPILYWRGGLGQRFSLSVILAITTMNLSVSSRMWWWHGVSYRELQGLFAIVGCWMLFPILFLLTPINTQRLRFIVALCLLILSVCVSVIHMMDLRRSFELLYWESFYGAAFVYALIRRNWGRVVILEAATAADQIERTSSRTLLELMTVCGLGCAAASYWSDSSNDQSLRYFIQASVLGIASVLVSMACTRIVMRWRLTKVPSLLLYWAAMWFLIVSNSILIVYNGRPGLSLNWMAMLDSLEFLLVTAGAIIASLEFVLFSVCISTWLKFCGWKIQERPVLELS